MRTSLHLQQPKIQTIPSRCSLSHRWCTQPSRRHHYFLPNIQTILGQVGLTSWQLRPQTTIGRCCGLFCPQMLPYCFNQDLFYADLFLFYKRHIWAHVFFLKNPLILDQICFINVVVFSQRRWLALPPSWSGLIWKLGRVCGSIKTHKGMLVI